MPVATICREAAPVHKIWRLAVNLSNKTRSILTWIPAILCSTDVFPSLDWRNLMFVAFCLCYCLICSLFALFCCLHVHGPLYLWYLIMPLVSPSIPFVLFWCIYISDLAISILLYLYRYGSSPKSTRLLLLCNMLLFQVPVSWYFIMGLLITTYYTLMIYNTIGITPRTIIMKTVLLKQCIST